MYEEGLNEATGVEKITTSSLTENMRMLIDRKVDLTLDDERVLRYAINQSMLQSMAALVILAKPLVMRGINIGVSRKNTGHAMIVARFNKAIAVMKEYVTHGRIVQ